MGTQNIILGLLVKDWMNSLCPSCQNHQQTLGSYCNATCESLIHSAKDCIPVHLCRHVPEWNDSAEIASFLLTSDMDSVWVSICWGKLKSVTRLKQRGGQSSSALPEDACMCDALV